MKFGKVANNSIESNKALEDGVIAMGIDKAPSSLIIKYITDMYSSPLDAAIRETISNALDASPDYVDAQITPSGVFTVCDHGPGMDEEKLANVYTQYGVSDKRGSDDTIGAFGLGAKSPLAYTDTFYVVTKATGNHRFLMELHRTSDDRFIAKNPENIDDAETIVLFDNTLNLDEMLANDETGTVVCFKIALCDINHARTVLRAVDDLMYETGKHGVCMNANHSNRSHAFDVSSTEITDVNGISAPMSVFLYNPDRDRFYNQYSRRIGDAVGSILLSKSKHDVSPQDMHNSISLKNIAFKIGCWLYPADGSIWKYDEDARGMSRTGLIIIDVPSSALSFIPSRDALLVDNKSSNIREICWECSKLVYSALDDEHVCAKMFNFIMNGKSISKTLDEINISIPSKSGRWTTGASRSDNLVNGMLSATWTPDDPEYNNGEVGRLTMCIDDLEAAPGCSLGDVMRTPSAVVSLAKFDGTGQAAYASVECAQAQALSTCRINGNKVNGFFKLKGATVADSVVGYGANTLLDAHGAYKSDMEMIKRNALHATLKFPVAAGVMSVLENSKPSSIIVIDGSESGVSYVRRNMKYLVSELDSKPRVGTVIMPVIIPPKTMGLASWDDSEIKNIIDVVTVIGKSYSVETMIVKKDDVRTLVNKAKSRKTAGDPADMVKNDISKMVSKSNVITIIDTSDTPFYYFSHDPFKVAYNVDSDALAKEIIESPHDFGIVACDSDANNARSITAVDKARKYAKAILAIGTVDIDALKQIVCIPSRSLSKKRAQLVKRLGCTVIYDERDADGDDTIIPGNVLSIGNGSNWLPVYSGEKVCEELRNVTEVKHADRIKIDAYYKTQIVCREIESSIERKETMSALSEIIKTMTYDHLNIDAVDKLKQDKMEKYGVDVARFANTCWRLKHVDTSENARFMRDDAFMVSMKNVISSLEDAMRIWKHTLDNNALTLTKYESDKLSKIQEIGRFLGVESMISAYFAGVPLEDLLD